MYNQTICTRRWLEAQQLVRTQTEGVTSCECDTYVIFIPQNTRTHTPTERLKREKQSYLYEFPYHLFVCVYEFPITHPHNSPVTRVPAIGHQTTSQTVGVAIGVGNCRCVCVCACTRVIVPLPIIKNTHLNIRRNM